MLTSIVSQTANCSITFLELHFILRFVPMRSEWSVSVNADYKFHFAVKTWEHLSENFRQWIGEGYTCKEVAEVYLFGKRNIETQVGGFIFKKKQNWHYIRRKLSVWKLKWWERVTTHGTSNSVNLYVQCHGISI